MQRMIGINSFFHGIKDDDGRVIWGWDAVDYFEIEWPEENLCVLTVYSNNSDMYLTFSEFVLEGFGSYLSVIPSIYEIYMQM